MQLDRTRNEAGPGNRAALLRVKDCFNQSLIDGFVADDWIAPEHRDREVIALYQGQMAAERKARAEQDERAAAAQYAALWVVRWLEDVA